MSIAIFLPDNSDKFILDIDASIFYQKKLMNNYNNITNIVKNHKKV